MIENLYFSNIDKAATVGSMTDALVDLWPEVFRGPRDEGSLAIKIYRDGERFSATAYGVFADFDQMVCDAEGKKLLGKDIRIKPDSGEAREPNGKLSNPMNGHDRHQRDLLFGKTSRKVLQVFKPSFLQDLGYFILTLQDRKIFVDPIQVPFHCIKSAGYIEFQKVQNLYPFLRQVRYSSIMGVMQATSLLSNMEIGSKLITVYDEFGNAYSQSVRAKGLANPAASLENLDSALILDLDKYQKQDRYVPFDSIDPMILNTEFLNKEVTSYCWRCKNSYTLLGVDRNLGYIAGKCLCYYTGIRVSNQLEAFSWRTDSRSFTRLCGGEVGVGPWTFKSLAIWHEPMRRMYPDGSEYKRIILPILEDEWNESVKGLQSQYQCTGLILRGDFLESSNQTREAQNVYFMEVLIDTTHNSNWTVSSRVAVKHLKLEMNFTDNTASSKIQIRIVYGNLWKIKEVKGSSEQLQLCLSFKCHKWLVPTMNGNVLIHPQPEDVHYQSMRQCIDKLVQLEMGTEISDVDEDTEGVKLYSFLKLFIKSNIDDDSTLSVRHSTRSLKSTFPPPLLINVDDEEKNAKLQFIQSLLNKQQLVAHENAVMQSVSLINGPPGTGKTFVALCITMTLALQEPGAILLTAPSNVASDGLCEQAMRMFQKLGIKPSIVRIMAKSKETWSTDSNISASVEPDFPLLHTLVQNHPNWRTLEMTDVFKLLDEGNEHKLQNHQRKRFYDHVHQLEKLIIQDYKLIVCTVDTMSDSRIKSFSEKISITTLLIEEAGQMTQPDTVFASLFLEPIRIVLVGDYLQLPATIQSKSAERAGLSKSQLEWCADLVLDNSSASGLFPASLVTRLNEQYRMEPGICTLVSNLSYLGKLCCGKSVLDASRNPPFQMTIVKDAFPELGTDNSVLVFNQKGIEQRVGCSYKNAMEAKTVALIVFKLIKSGVQAHHIVVLTTYEAQKVEIKSQLCMQDKLDQHSRSAVYNAVEIANVDSFQGKESAIVIVSLVRSNNKKAVGFVSSLNRLNVALSRAMWRLFVVADFSTFSSHGSYSSIKLVKELTAIGINGNV